MKLNANVGANKKMLNMLILKILKDYTDADHPLTQQEIIDLLRRHYSMDCDPRSIRNNIRSLKDMGYEIVTRRGCYLADREFDDAELRMLIDSVLFSKSISGKQAKRLIEKLKSFGNRYFHAKVSHVSNLPELFHTDNKQTMIALDVLNDAIEAKRKVSFVYNTYGADFKLHPKREDPYIVNPYQMVANNGRYYLIGNYDKYDNVSHYRIDRITSVTMLSEPVKPKSKVRDFAKGWSLPKHMAEHIYMFSGESVTVKLMADTYLMDDLVDWFGRDFHVRVADNGKMAVTLKCNESAMKYWALQYGECVEILSPVSLRESIAEIVRGMYGTYCADVEGQENE
ncbi:MAG: WYL domain-containing transcriptional regulator [Schwartzia sp.]|nr:WYL domain-containing transcriptional regulator [Schwartzia sp. (in: firmicutes)]